jgi:hypothetical protein
VEDIWPAAKGLLFIPITLNRPIFHYTCSHRYTANINLLAGRSETTGAESNAKEIPAFRDSIPQVSPTRFEIPMD